jgi:hypothetical protein
VSQLSDDIQYKKVSPDPAKACINCKHFKSNDDGDDDTGDCFGYTVSAKATCNNFEAK